MALRPKFFSEMFYLGRTTYGTSFRPVSYGPELCSDTGFNTPAYWSLTSGHGVVSGGKLVFTAAPTLAYIGKVGVLKQDRVYTFTFTIDSITSGGIRVASGVSNYTGTTYNAAGTYTEVLYLPATGTEGRINIQTVGTTTATIDNISVKEVILDRAGDPIHLFNAPPNTPRHNYDLITGVYKGVLFEGSSSNLISRGDIAGTIGSVPTGMSYAQPPQVSTEVFIPGTNGLSCKHIRNTTTAPADDNVGYFVFTANASTIYTASIYCYLPADSTAAAPVFTCESANCSVSGTRTIDKSKRDQWQRVVFTITTNASFTNGNVATVILRTGDAINGSYLYTDCWQVETGTYATSVIPTTNGTTSRAAEIIYIQDISKYYNALEGTVYVEYTADATLPSATYGLIFQLDDGTNANRVVLKYNPANSTGGYIQNTSIVQMDNSYTMTLGNTNKYAIAYANNDCADSFNGSAALADTTTNIPPSINRLVFNNSGPGIKHILRFKYYPKRLSNAKLQQLTT